MSLTVVYSSDNNYAQHVGVSMTSLFQNNLEFDDIVVYLIERDITLENKMNLIEICNQYNRRINFIDFNDFNINLNLKMGSSISINAYARLFLCSAIKESVEKILYLDSDSIVNENLQDLWETDITDYYVAGVLDTVSENTKIQVNMDINEPYINSGMLLINLKRWREDQIEEKFLEFIKKYNGNVFHHDQGTINGVLNERFLILPPKYNVMTPFFTMNRSEIMNFYGLKEYYSESELKEAISNPIFIHFTPAFVNRPWIVGCKHPLKTLYQKYLELTPWRDTDLLKDNRSKVEKIIAFLYNNLPFKVANGVCNLIFR